MEILEKLKRPLPITDIDFRIQSINKGGYATIIAYKDARVDMNRLDEVCGTHWQKDYKTIDGSLYCGIGIKVGSEWLWRWDVGTESFSDKEKGKASDAFKRAGFCWGIGRELYQYPPIEIRLKPDEFTVFKRDNGETGKVSFNLDLKNWIWDIEFNHKNQVTGLTATDEHDVKRYHYSMNKTKPEKTTDAIGDSSSKKKYWLNKKDKDGNFTREWLNVVTAIGSGKVTSVEQVKEYYKVSKAMIKEIENTINLATMI